MYEYADKDDETNKNYVVLSRDASLITVNVIKLKIAQTLE